MKKRKKTIKRLYDVNASIPTKIEHLAKNIYHAKHVKYTKKALDEIKLLESLNLDKMPICVAKTPMSISDNKELLGYPKDYQINVTDIKISNGAGFIIVYMGNILTMPGLSKNAAYLALQIMAIKHDDIKVKLQDLRKQMEADAMKANDEVIEKYK